MKTLNQEQIDFLVKKGYSDPKLVIQYGPIYDDYEIWAFCETDATAVIPAPVPHAIAHAACLLDEDYAVVHNYKQIEKRNRAWYRRNDQVQLWLKAFPFLKSLHCNGCGIIHVPKEAPNYCDRCKEFLRQREADWDISF